MWKRTGWKPLTTALVVTGFVLVGGGVVFAFAALGPGRGPSTAAPLQQTVTPVATPTCCISPEDFYRTPRPAEATARPLPTNTPLPPSGGPYISESRAIEIGMDICRDYGPISEGIAARAMFGPAYEVVPRIDGRPMQGLTARELWIVVVEGRFKPLGAPSGVDLSTAPAARLCHVVIDATTGRSTGLILREEAR
jgi:hypothetical protein